MFGELRKSRNLLYNLVRRDLTVRYKSTVLGFFWSFVKPLVLTGIFWVVFDKVLKQGVVGSTATQVAGRTQVPFALHLLTGILAWTFFSGATSESLGAILANGNLIKKIKLPLAVFPTAVVISHLVHFLLALLVLVALLILNNLPPTSAFMWLPLIIALQFLLTLAFAMALSALNVFYRDISSIWEVLATAWFYGTPIVYPFFRAAEALQSYRFAGLLKWLFLANPMTPLVLAYRRVMIYAAVDPPQPEISDSELFIALGLCAAITVGLLLGGRKVFKHFAHSFADEL